jgi:Fe-S cluster assembly iron-binding protein IscA
MIAVTAHATEHLTRIRDASDVDRRSGIRLMKAKTPTGIAVAFSRQPELGDDTIRRPGLSIYVAHEIADLLDGAMIDVREVDGEENLVLRPPGRNPTDQASIGQV